MVRRWTGWLLLACAVAWAGAVAVLAVRDGYADGVLLVVAVLGVVGAGALVAGDALHERRRAAELRSGRRSG